MAQLTRKIIDGEHYVVRYAQNRLSDLERAEFEEFYLLHPDVVEDVRADRVLIRGLRALDVAVPKRAVASWRHLVRAVGVAGAVAVVAVALLLRMNESPPSRLYALDGKLPAVLAADLRTSIRLVRMRGGYMPVAQLPPDAAALRIVIDVSKSPGAPPWEISLKENVGSNLRLPAALSKMSPPLLGRSRPGR